MFVSPQRLLYFVLLVWASPSRRMARPSLIQNIKWIASERFPLFTTTGNRRPYVIDAHSFLNANGLKVYFSIVNSN
jgi:hypothetical protein